jgi:lysophospholipase L1-like esterase
MPEMNTISDSQAARPVQSPIKIVCLGDSLTYGFGVSRRDTWVSLTTERTGMELVNCGINGDTTGGMLARLRDEATTYSPGGVLMMGGSNDIFISGTAESAKANMSALSHQVVAIGAIPLIATPPPLDVENIRRDWASLSDAARAQKIGNEYAEWLRLFAGVFDITVIDFRAAFEAVTNTERRRALYIDGLHPTPEGHRLMADVLCCKLLERELFPMSPSGYP